MQNLSSSHVALVQENIELAKSYGILHVNVDATQSTGRTIVVNGQEIVNFGSCSYLGLENDPAWWPPGVRRLTK